MPRSIAQNKIDEIIGDACNRLPMVIKGIYADQVMTRVEEKPGMDDIDVYLFPQTWANTSCGFGGVSGQAFTRSTTIVVMLEDHSAACVYFSGRFAYMVSPVTREFLIDLGSFNMAEVSRRSKYRDKQPSVRPS